MTIFISNFHNSLSEEDLKKLFVAYGEVFSIKIVRDKITKRTKGYGFVEMEDSDAEEAIRLLNGTRHKGRTLIVNEARASI